MKPISSAPMTPATRTPATRTTDASPLLFMATTNDQWQDQRMMRWCQTLEMAGWRVRWIGVDRNREVLCRARRTEPINAYAYHHFEDRFFI